MADENNDNIEKRIVISLDKSAADASLKGIQALDKESENLGKTLKNLGKTSSDYAGELRNAISQDNSAASGISKLSAEFLEQDSNVKKATSSLDDYAERLKEVKGNTELASGFGRTLGQLGGAANQVGLGGVGQAFQLGQAGSDVLEFVPQLKVQLEALSQSSTGAVASVTSLAAEALPATAAEFATVGLALGAVTVAALPLVAAGALLVKVFNDQAAATEALHKAQVEAEVTASNAVSSGATTADLVQQIAALGDQADETSRAIKTEQDARNASFEDGTYNLDLDKKRYAEIQRLNGVLATQVTTMNELQNQLGTADVAANDLAASEQFLADGRKQDAQDAIAAQQQALAQASQIRDRIAALQEQMVGLQENRSIQEANAAQTAALTAKFAQEDDKAQLTDHYAKLAAISKDGNAKLQAISADINDLPLQQAQDAAKIQQKGNESLNKLSQDYFATQLKAYTDFATQSGRIAEDTAKTAKRLAEDIRAKLSDAARDNDVVAFLQTQRDGQKELKRNAEDASQSEKRRAEDFSKQQEEQRSAFQARQAEILAGIADEKEKSLQAYAEKRAALEQQRKQEQDNIQAAIASENDRYTQQEQREAQQADRQAQFAALRQSQEDAAFARTLAGIQSKTDAEIAGLARVQAQANSLSLTSAQHPTYNSPSISGYGSFGGSSSKSPYDKIPTASHPIININTTVGDVATHSQVSNAITQSIGDYHNAFIKGTAQAQG